MIAKVTAFSAGVLFSVGLVVAGMTQPAKVIGFLDLAGNWDPSLALVMLGAIPVASIGFWLARGRTTAVCGAPLPGRPSTNLDKRLLGGALLFGAGWGIGGFCPGPGIVAVASMSTPALAFTTSMLAGMFLFTIAERVLAREEEEEPASSDLTAIDG